jgi:DNA-binding NarL/FixJ family response regulator
VSVGGDITGPHRRLGEPIRVLVIDDDEVDRELVRRLLVKAEILANVAEAADPMSGLAALRRGAFDLVVLDYNFPKHDGLFVLRELRELGSPVPVIALTGQDDASLAVELMKNGASDYIAKGALTAQRLAASVRHALRLRASDLATRAVQDALRASEELVRRILDVSQEYLAVLDADGRVLMTTTVCLRELDPGDGSAVRGRAFAELFDAGQRASVTAALADARAGRTARFVGLLPTKDGPARGWDVTVSAVPDADGKTERLLAVGRPISPR